MSSVGTDIMKINREKLIEDICSLFEKSENKFKLPLLLNTIIENYENNITPHIIVKNISAKPTTATNTTESKKTTSSEKKPKKITASDFAAAMIDNNFKDVYEECAQTNTNLTLDTIKTLSKDFSPKIKEKWDLQSESFYKTMADCETVLDFYNNVKSVFDTKIQLKSIMAKLISFIKYNFEDIDLSSESSIKKKTTRAPSVKHEDKKKSPLDYFQKFNSMVNEPKVEEYFSNQELVQKYKDLVSKQDGANTLMKINKLYRGLPEASKEAFDKYFNGYPVFDSSKYENTDEGRKAAKEGEKEMMRHELMKNEEDFFEMIETYMMSDD